jgi:hypothetical protein
VRGFFRGRLRKLNILLALAAVSLAAYPPIERRAKTEEARVREAVTGIVAAASRRDAKGLLDRVWIDYTDSWRHISKKHLDASLGKFFGDYPRVEVQYSPFVVKIEPPEAEGGPAIIATVRLEASLRTAGKDGREVNVNDKLGASAFELTMRKDDVSGRWLLQVVRRIPPGEKK